MNRKYSLKRNHDIEILVKLRQSVGNKSYTVYYAYQDDAECKIAISVSKKFGNAVARNYGKRVVREIIRDFLPNLEHLKCLIVIKKDCENKSYIYRKEQLIYLLKKIIKNKEKTNNG